MILHYPHEEGISWSAWLKPNEDHDHFTWLWGLSRHLHHVKAPNGMTGLENLSDKRRRYLAADIPILLTTASHGPFVICDCLGCHRRQLLASLKLATFEKRSAAIARCIEELQWLAR